MIGDNSNLYSQASFNLNLFILPEENAAPIDLESCALISSPCPDVSTQSAGLTTGIRLQHRALYGGGVKCPRQIDFIQIFKRFGYFVFYLPPDFSIIKA